MTADEAKELMRMALARLGENKHDYADIGAASAIETYVSTRVAALPKLAASAGDSRAELAESEGPTDEDGAREMYEFARAQPGTNPPSSVGHIPNFDGLDEYGKAWMLAAYRFVRDLKPVQRGPEGTDG